MLERLKETGQEHILHYLAKLPRERRIKLENQIRTIDFQLISKLYHTLILSKEKISQAELKPAPFISLAYQKDNQDECRRMIEQGEKALRLGKIAALVVAGGQGSRLGFKGPKGAFPISPIKQKSLFQLHAEKILAINRRHNISIPWYIMTSEENNKATRLFFESHNYFGLAKEEIFFFIQGKMPAIDHNGKVIFNRKDHIFMNPDGHGGTLRALATSGALDDMKQRNIEEVFYFQIDNVLIDMCDPLFIGYHVCEGAEMSAKVAAKRDPFEKLGVIGKRDGILSVIEYSDMSKADMKARNPDGTLKYNTGNLAIHLFNREFLERESEGGTRLPWHVAHKKIPYIDDEGSLNKPKEPNGYKFETFIFDAISHAKKVVILEVDRRNNFSPVKNSTGADSPQTAKRDMSNLYAGWLERCGISVERDSDGWPKAKIEISPLFALDAAELSGKISPDLKIGDELYLGR